MPVSRVNQIYPPGPLHLINSSMVQVVVAGGYSGRAGWLRDLDVLNNLTPNCDQVTSSPPTVTMFLPHPHL